MKPFYYFLDGPALVSVPVVLKDKLDTKHPPAFANLYPGGSDPKNPVPPLVENCRFSAKPADGCWSLVDQTPPAATPPEPDKDARIAELEAEVSALKAAKPKEEKDDGKDSKKDDKKTS